MAREAGMISGRENFRGAADARSVMLRFRERPARTSERAI